MTATYRLPPLRWGAPILVWGPSGIDYASLERKLVAAGATLEDYLRRTPEIGDWIIWRTNGRKLAGRVARCRESKDYEVYLLNPENHTHIVVVQGYEIVKVRPNHLEVLAATA